MRESERLRIGEIERGREIDREIVAQFVLRERRAIAVGDLAARGRNVEHVSARLLLRFQVGLIVSSKGVAAPVAWAERRRAATQRRNRMNRGLTQMVANFGQGFESQLDAR